MVAEEGHQGPTSKTPMNEGKTRAMEEERGDKAPGILRKAAALVAGGASAIFLANLPGIPPEIPDLLPVVGNLDELLASAILLWAGRTLGVSPGRLLEARRERKQLKAAAETQTEQGS